MRTILGPSAGIRFQLTDGLQRQQQQQRFALLSGGYKGERIESWQFVLFSACRSLFVLISGGYLSFSEGLELSGQQLWRAFNAGKKATRRSIVLRAIIGFLFRSERENIARQQGPLLLRRQLTGKTVRLERRAPRPAKWRLIWRKLMTRLSCTFGVPSALQGGNSVTNDPLTVPYLAFVKCSASTPSRESESFLSFCPT